MAYRNNRKYRGGKRFGKKPYGKKPWKVVYYR